MPTPWRSGIPSCGVGMLYVPCVPAPARSPRLCSVKNSRVRFYTGNSGLSLCNPLMGFRGFFVVVFIFFSCGGLFWFFFPRPGNCHIKGKYKKNDFPSAKQPRERLRLRRPGPVPVHAQHMCAAP